MGSQPDTTTQISKVDLPDWVEKASEENYDWAKDISARPHQPYTGQRVAGLTPMEQAAGNTLSQGMGVTNTALQQALAGAKGAQGYSPQMIAAMGGVANVNAPGAVANVAAPGGVANVAGPAGVSDVEAQSFLSRDIGAYMDPYTNQVVDTTLGNLDRNIAQGKNAIYDQAAGAGAFGGSRHGVQEAVYSAEGDRNKAGVEAGLRSAAYQDAASRIQQDNQSALQAALANQASGLTTQGQGLQAALANQQSGLTTQAHGLQAGLANQQSAHQTNQSALQAALANQAAGLTTQGHNLAAQQSNQSAGLAGAAARLQGGQLALQTGQAASDTAGRNALLQSQFGGTQRGLNQAELDSKYASFLEQRDYPVEQLNMRLAALGMSPYGKTQSTTTTQSGGSNGMLTGIGAAATILPLLFGSDRKIKKNVKKIGKVPGTDLNKYEFQYKKGFMGGDEEKHVGLMAQDVEKKLPNSGAVQTVKQDGKSFKAVNYDLAILRGKQRKGRNDKGKVRAPYLPRIGIGSRAA